MAIEQFTPRPSNLKVSDAIKPRSLVLVCTYNEADNLRPLFMAISRSIPDADVLVIDDGSPDGTGELAEELAQENRRLRVIHRDGKQGLGSAICLGLQEAIDRNYDFVLNMDADFSHSPDDLPLLLQVAMETDDWIDVTIGSRYVVNGRVDGWPLHRLLMSRLVNRFAIFALRLPVKDCSGGLRCYRVDQLRRIEFSALRSDGYSIQQELLLCLRVAGASMREMPIVFTERERGVSKLTFREAVRSVRQLLEMALQSSTTTQIMNRAKDAH